MGCGVTQDGSHLDRHLGFYPKLKIIRKRRKLTYFDASDVEFDIIRYFASFCEQKSPKKVKKTDFFYSKLARPPAAYDATSRNPK